MRMHVFLAAFALGAPALSSAAPAVPTDYANGFELHTSVTAPAYRVTLDATVYRQLQRSDLADIAVFNSAGQAVPQAIERPRDDAALPAQRPLPFYAIAQQGAQIAGPLKLRVDAGGAVVQMETPAGMQEPDGSSAVLQAPDGGRGGGGIMAQSQDGDGVVLQRPPARRKHPSRSEEHRDCHPRRAC